MFQSFIYTTTELHVAVYDFAGLSAGRGFDRHLIHEHQLYKRASRSGERGFPIDSLPIHTGDSFRYLSD